MQIDQDDSGAPKSGGDSRSVLRRLYKTLKAIDSAMDYDPLDEVLTRLQHLEREVAAIKLSLANKPQ